MRIAFVDNLSVGGGLSRFSLLLCKSLIESFPLINIDYLIHNDNVGRIPELKNIPRVKICIIKASVSPSYLKRKLMQVTSKLKWADPNTDRIMAEVEHRVGKDYDIAFFPSAHMMRRPNLSIPVVGTLHDFNWKYFFGNQIFSKSFVEVMNNEILKWMNEGLNVCSSYSVLNEAKKFYPAARNYPAVVPIGPVIVNGSITENRAAEILLNLGIDFPYLIFPANFFPHKNHLNLFTAFYLLKQRKGFQDYKLILTGFNSDQVERGKAGYSGVRLGTKEDNPADFDVIGLGYQTNEVIDALISKAKLLVSPSIYEAICTPAMDAWSFATPTAISNIAPFKEHESAWGIKSAFFDPMDPKNIADVIEGYLNNYEEAKKDAKISKNKMAEYPWKKVAEGYMNVFTKALKN